MEEVWLTLLQKVVAEGVQDGVAGGEELGPGVAGGSPLEGDARPPGESVVGQVVLAQERVGIDPGMAWHRAWASLRASSKTCLGHWMSSFFMAARF